MLVVMIGGYQLVNIDHGVFLGLVHGSGLLDEVLLIELELDVVEEREALLSRHPRQRLMRDVLLPHDEELEVGLEEEQPQGTGLLITLLLH